ncbi:Wzz/FepE/Etk N-terminal domain-containing protein, partial [Rhizobiaceae sp. 2RAB30]
MGDLDLRFYLSILLRRAPYFLATAAAVVVTVAIVSFFLPEVYRASSKIMVEAPQIPTELARSTVPTTALEQLQIVQEQASTTDNLVALARKLNVYGSDIAGISDTDIAKDMRSRISYEQVSPPAQEVTVVEISFDAADPTLAANVANEIVSFILGKNARQRTDRAGDTTQFFEGEVERLKTELAKIEADLLKFKTDNKDTLPDSLEFRRTQQAAQQERLMLLEREEAELRSRRNNLVRTYETTGIITKSGPVTPEQQMLQDLNRALSDQLAIFSEDSPNIQALRKRIAAVQEGLRDRQANSQDSDG